MGDVALADALARFSTSAFGAGWEESEYYLRDAPRTIHATALFALASAIEAGGAGFAQLFTAPPNRTALSEPYLNEVSSPSSQAPGVSRAEYDGQEKALNVTLCLPGDPALVRASSPIDATLTIGSVPANPRIEVNGRPLAEDEYSRRRDKLVFNAVIAPEEGTRCMVRMGD